MNAFNLGTHLHQAFRHIANFRLTCGIFNNRITPGQNGSHQGRMGGSNGHHGKLDMGTPKAAFGRGVDIARANLEFSAKLLHRHDVKINRPRTDGAATGKRNLGFATTCQQGPQNPEAGPHFRHQIIGGSGINNGFGGNFQGFTGSGRLAGLFAGNSYVHAVIL